MVKKLTLTIISLFLVRLVSGQETDSIKKKNSFSVFVESPFFFKDWGQESAFVLTLNAEYLLTSENNSGVSFRLGYGKIFYTPGWKYFDPYAQFEVSKLIGKKINFLELGGGFGYAGDVFLNLRFGYRLHINNRILFRIAYTPAFYPKMHTDTEEYPDFTGFNALSVGLGYRFGIKTSKEKWNTNWRWLSGMQLNFQPFFKNYKGYKGYYGEVELELLLYSSNDVSINGIIGFGYGSVKSKYSRFAYNSIPFGVRLLYGRKKHFLEAGVKSAWIPVGGNSDGTFFTLQPELGYRFCPGKHFTARVAYTPYWWLPNNSGKEYVDQKFVHSVTIGIGWRFH